MRQKQVRRKKKGLGRAAIIAASFLSHRYEGPPRMLLLLFFLFVTSILHLSLFLDACVRWRAGVFSTLSFGPLRIVP